LHQNQKKLEGKFYGIEFHHVIRDANQAVDHVSKLGSTRAKVPAGVFVQDLMTPSIKPGQEIIETPSAEQLVMAVLATSNDWRDQFIKYLTSVEVPTSKIGTERLIRRSKHYILVNRKLMQKNAKEEVLLKYISKVEGEKLLIEIHAGSCGNHVASRNLVGKAFRAAFYWPSTVADAEALIHRCEGCQFFTKQIHVPTQALQTIPTSWPFACWGLNMIGPFKPAPGGFRYVYVAIDKFSKWIEYKPLIMAIAKKAADLLQDIVHRFGMPNSIITDLGSTFTSNNF
jgi:hypothetical protein